MALVGFESLGQPAVVSVAAGGGGSSSQRGSEVTMRTSAVAAATTNVVCPSHTLPQLVGVRGYATVFQQEQQEKCVMVAWKLVEMTKNTSFRKDVGDLISGKKEYNQYPAMRELFSLLQQYPSSKNLELFVQLLQASELLTDSTCREWIRQKLLAYSWTTPGFWSVPTELVDVEALAKTSGTPLERYPCALLAWRCAQLTNDSGFMVNIKAELKKKELNPHLNKLIVSLLEYPITKNFESIIDFFKQPFFTSEEGVREFIHRLLIAFTDQRQGTQVPSALAQGLPLTKREEIKVVETPILIKGQVCVRVLTCIDDTSNR